MKSHILKNTLAVAFVVLLTAIAVENLFPNSIFHSRVSEIGKQKHQYMMSITLCDFINNYKDVKRHPPSNAKEFIEFLKNNHISDCYLNEVNRSFEFIQNCTISNVIVIGLLPDQQGFVYGITSDGIIIKIRADMPSVNRGQETNTFSRPEVSDLIIENKLSPE